MTDRDEGDALFAAAWQWDMAGPLADWLADRLPMSDRDGVRLATAYPTVFGSRLLVMECYALAGVPNMLGAWVFDNSLAVNATHHLPRDPAGFTAEFPAWLRGAFAEVRRARAAADRP